MTHYENTIANYSSNLTVIENTSDQQIQNLALTIAEAADDRKGSDITILKVTEISYLTDYFVIVTGFSRTQVKAIAEAIEEKVYQTHQQVPRQTEGKNDGNWVLQDFGDVIVHIFLPEEREFYNLEAFWGHAERLEFSSLEVTQSSRL
ncbi:putative Iojap-related protein [Crocosphaera subtropica ATCC 51142]|uniref:Ribosomal silencing factor RsfS n=1 Tax=Crocosphaera subtropica (strain ATCC 51142 / BH68) TaxID=43989 RepID=B1WTU4_CROS5|nr:ribosome silencing factor [Crocosphaera subtropica]ACB50410.1 putative Iojap-related protein [Crocosphaera subtropica ATCC 51142]